MNVLRMTIGLMFLICSHLFAVPAFADIAAGDPCNEPYAKQQVIGEDGTLHVCEEIGPYCTSASAAKCNDSKICKNPLTPDQQCCKCDDDSTQPSRDPIAAILEAV